MTQKQRSIFEYVSKSTTTVSQQKSVDVKEEIPIDEFFCPLCQFNLTKFNIDARTVHINRCIDPPLGKNQTLPKKRRNSLERSPKKSSPQKKKKLEPEIIEILEEEENDEDLKIEISSEIKETFVLDSTTTKNECDEIQEKVNQLLEVIDDMEAEKEIQKMEDSNKSTKPAPKKRRGKAKPPIPFEKILKFGDDEDNILAVDAFCYAPDERIKVYLLTHFHSDHYGGLCKSWDNAELIVCTKITAKLMIQKFKYPSEKIFVLEKYGEMINIPNTKLRISVFDANHCPGAGIYVIEHTEKKQRYLHCGDFRANDAMIDELLIDSKDGFDKCYLDTTYLNPAYTFANQTDVVNYTSEWVKNKFEVHKSKQQRIVDFFHKSSDSKIKEFLVVIGTYSIGKEKLAIGISNALDTKIYCTKEKYNIFKQYEWKELDDRLDTENDMDCGIHLLPMSKTNKDYLVEYFKKYSSRYKSILVFIPTGWTSGYGSRKAKVEQLLSIKESMFRTFDAGFNVGGSKGNLVIVRKIMVPYSEHSSYTDLTDFIHRVPSKEWIPTVNMNRFDEQVEMIREIGIGNGNVTG